MLLRAGQSVRVLPDRGRLCWLAVVVACSATTVTVRWLYRRRGTPCDSKPPKRDVVLPEVYFSWHEDEIDLESVLPEPLAIAFCEKPPSTEPQADFWCCLTYDHTARTLGAFRLIYLQVRSLPARRSGSLTRGPAAGAACARAFATCVRRAEAAPRLPSSRRRGCGRRAPRGEPGPPGAWRPHWHAATTALAGT